MRELYFDVWTGDDLLGTAVGELTDAADKKVTVVDNGMGNGSFTISRHSSQYAWVTPGPTTPEPLIRCRREAGGPFDYDDARYFGAFFVEEGNDVLVSPDEEGGEDATRSGRGIESILSRAVIDFEAHYVDDIVAHPYDKTALTDGQWHMDEDIPGAFSNAGTPGAVLRIFLRNAGAQTPEPIPEVTHDFNINVDSNGDAWPDGDAKWSFDVGTTLLDVLGILVNGGLFYKMTPDLVLHAWGTAQGTDLSGSITFAQGADIATSGERAIHASPAKSRLLVKGQTTGGGRVYRWRADTGIESVLGVRQGSLDYQASPTNAILDKAGDKALADLMAQHDGPPTMGVDEASGQEAFIDYLPGDTVTVDIPSVYDTDAVRIFSVTLQETETGDADPIVEFAGEAWSGIEGPGIGTLRVGGDSFFIEDPFGTFTGPGEAIAFRPPFKAIGAFNNENDHWAYFYLENDAYLLNMQDGTATGDYSGYAAHEIFPEGQYFEGDIFNFDIGGTADDAKYYFNEGWGIVIPYLAADPAGGASEAGQVYWNTASLTIRWYNGTIWQDVGAGVGGGAITPVTIFAESNTPGNTNATPNTPDQVPFDTFYDVDNVDLSGVLPAGLALTYTGGDEFEADEDGVWVVSLGMDIVVSPGNTGQIDLAVPDTGYNPVLYVAAASNPPAWVAERTIPMRTGQTFSVRQRSSAASETIIDGYVMMVITRIANAVS